MTVKELIEKLKTMPPDAEVIHINYRWHKKTAYSDPDVFLNIEGSCSLGARLVGVRGGQKNDT